PQLDSNLASLRNSSAPHPRQRYTPSVLVSLYSPVKGRSVPACRRTWYSSGLSGPRPSVSSWVKSSRGERGWGAPLRTEGCRAAAPQEHHEHGGQQQQPCQGRVRELGSPPAVGPARRLPEVEGEEPVRGEPRRPVAHQGPVQHNREHDRDEHHRVVHLAEGGDE